MSNPRSDLWYASRVRINSQGYDAQGNYWGLGQPLWHIRNASGRQDNHLRAPNRERAKELAVQLRAVGPYDHFYR